MEKSENNSVVASICSLFDILQTAKNKKCILNSLSKLFLLIYNERIKRKLLYNSNEDDADDDIKLKRILRRDSVILDTYKNSFTEYEKWLTECLKKFLKLLFQLLNHNDEIFIKKSLSLLFGSLQCELKIYEKICEKLNKDNYNNNEQESYGKKAFPFKLYREIIFNILKMKNISVNIIKHICKSYICFYYDLNYFFLLIFKFLCMEQKKKTDDINESNNFSEEDPKTLKNKDWVDIEGKGEFNEIINDNYNINLFIYSILINSIKPEKKIKDFHIKKSKFMKQSQVDMFLDLDEKEKIMRRKRKFKGKNNKNNFKKKKGFYKYDSDDSIVHSSSDGESSSSSEDFLDNIDINDDVSDIHFSDDLREYDIIKKKKKENKYKMKERKENLFLNVNIENKRYGQLYSSCWFYFITTNKHNYSMILHLLHSIPLFVFPYTNNPYYLIDYFNFSFYSSPSLYISLAALPGIFHILTELNIGDLLEESNYCIMNDQIKTKKEIGEIKIKKEPLDEEEVIRCDSANDKIDNSLKSETDIQIKIEKKDAYDISNVKNNCDNLNKIYNMDQIKDSNKKDINSNCDNNKLKGYSNDYDNNSIKNNQKNCNKEIDSNKEICGDGIYNSCEIEYNNENECEKKNKNYMECISDNDKNNQNNDYHMVEQEIEEKKEKEEMENEEEVEVEEVEDEEEEKVEEEEEVEDEEEDVEEEEVKDEEEKKKENGDIKKLNNNMYTDYYKRLFELITPASFYYDNTNFLKIIYLSLKNKMIPLYYVISFLKKLLRVGCLTSHNISINILSVVYDILNYFKKDLFDAMFVSASLFMNMVVKNDLFCYENLNKNFDKNKIIEILKANSKLLKENYKEEKDNLENIESEKMGNGDCFMIHKKIKKEIIDADDLLIDECKKNESNRDIVEEKKVHDNFKEEKEDTGNKDEKILFSLQDCLPDKYQIDMNILNKKELYMANQIFYEIILLNNHICENLNHYSSVYYYSFNNKSNKAFDFYVDPKKMNWIAEESLFSFLKSFLSLKKRREKDILPSEEPKNFSSVFI